MGARDEIETVMRDYAITVDAEFVPWSKSRSYDAKCKRVMDRNLNWHITIKRDGREVLTTDYSAGIAHAPSYSNARVTLEVEEGLKYETENGKKARGGGSVLGMTGREPIVPNACDVLACLVMDARVLDCASFEDWASELGYEADSRKAESMYQECLKQALQLRAGLGDDGLRALQHATRDW